MAIRSYKISATTGNDSATILQPNSYDQWVYTWDGLAGTDQLGFDRLGRSEFTITKDTAGTIHVDSVSGASHIISAKLTNVEKLSFNYGRDVVDLVAMFGGSTATPDTSTNDVVTVKLGNARVDTQAGIDTVLLPLFPNTYTLSQTGASASASGTYGGRYTLELLNVEYVQFGSGDFKTKLALSEITSGTAREQLGKLTDLYLAFFGRAPDVPGLEFWQRQFMDADLKSSGTNQDFSALGQEFAKSQEAQALFPANSSNRDFVRIIYQNCFGRDPDAGGWDFWTRELDKLGKTDLSNRGTFVAGVIQGAYAPTSGPADKNYLSNRHDVAMYYVNELSVAPQEGFDNSINALLDRVTQDSTTRGKAQAVIDYAFANPVTLTGVMNDAALLNSIWGA